MKCTVGFIGCGNMGGAIASRICLKENVNVLIYDKSSSQTVAFVEKNHGSAAAPLEDVIKSSDFVFLAVKPQVIGAVLDEIKPVLGNGSKKPVFVSMVAGWSVDMILESLGDCPLIRIMPNTPVSVGKGMIVFASKNVSDKEKSLFEEIMSECGMLDEIDEGKIDAVTALSGCGPAFVYMFAYAMSDAGVANGLTRSQALKYSAQTLLGSAEMILSSGKHPMELKDNVCSPGGSTIAGVMALDDGGFSSAVEDAVKKAYEKTKELGKK